MATVSSGSKKERFGFIERHGSELGVRYLCDWLKVSAPGYYKHCRRGVSKRVQSDRELTKKIEKIFVANDSNYGSPRVYRALRKQGMKVGRTRVERLMRDAGLVGKAGRLYRRRAKTVSFYTKMPNLRAGLPLPTAINQQWVGDLTYIKVSGEWRYLAVVMDLYSRRVIGWKLGKYKTAELTLAALKQALRYREVEAGLIFHTDRGSEYGAYLIQAELKRHGLKPSMNRPGYVTDNAHMESFFRSMKTECIKEVEFANETDLRVVLSQYVNIYYNKKRLHSGIDYNSPVEYEQQTA